MRRPLLFLLPGGGSGGAHSVVQEVGALNRLGVRAFVGVTAEPISVVEKSYADIGLPPGTLVKIKDQRKLREYCQNNQVEWVIATANQSVRMMDEATVGTEVRRAYYIQDYEPLFYSPNTDGWIEARRSYEIKDTTFFAKTGWLQDVVRRNHGINVCKVAASVDHSIFHPQSVTEDHSRDTICAMVRPSTPRRAPHRTARILEWIVQQGASRVCAFGASNEELAAHRIELAPGIERLGYISRTNAGELFRRTKLFLDLSDYQAFGRTAVEAMSCGALVIVPSLGGADDFVISGVNAFEVDARDERAVYRTVSVALGLAPGDDERMRWRAIETGYRYTPEKAAFRIVEVLRAASGF